MVPSKEILLYSFVCLTFNMSEDTNVFNSGNALDVPPAKDCIFGCGKD